MFFRPGSGFFFVPSNFEFVLQCVCMMFSLGSIFIYSRMGWVCTKQQRCDHKPRSQAIAGIGNHQLDIASQHWAIGETASTYYEITMYCNLNPAKGHGLPLHVTTILA